MKRLELGYYLSRGVDAFPSLVHLRVCGYCRVTPNLKLGLVSVRLVRGKR